MEYQFGLFPQKYLMGFLDLWIQNHLNLIKMGIHKEKTVENTLGLNFISLMLLEKLLDLSGVTDMEWETFSPNIGSK